MDKMKNVAEILQTCPLCQKMTQEEREEFAGNPACQIKTYEKSDFIFHEEEVPKKLFILLKGKVAIGKDTLAGKRILIVDIEKPGDLFGEVYLFIDRKTYDMHAQAEEKCVVLEVPKELLDLTQGESGVTSLIQWNLMKIFAQKAYRMNNKIKVLGSATVREKIVRYLFQCQQENGELKGNFAREDMADYMNVTRPSLSRELGKMQDEGIIKMNGRKIEIGDYELFEQYL